MFHHVSILSLLAMTMITVATMKGAHAVDYNVTNTAVGTIGGNRFKAEIGEDYAFDQLVHASNFTLTLFQQRGKDDRKVVDSISLFVEVSDVAVLTIKYRANYNYEIHVSATYLGNYNGNFRNETTGLIYHAIASIWQWDGKGQAPPGLVTGIADFVRLRSGYADSHWVQPGEGDRWDQGYDVTARFLDYCDRASGGRFVAKLNRKMKYTYSDHFFYELVGKSVDQLWGEYKSANGIY